VNSESTRLRDPRYYWRVWLASTVMVGAIFLIPFALFFLIFNTQPALKRTILLNALPCAGIGLVLTALASTHAVRYLHNLIRQTAKALELAEIREHERDLAQQELIRKLQQERELERKKVQFEAQLAEYEKYAALAQLALGAAHEINNPLLGILSHLELELRDARNPEQRLEIEQCIQGTKRISSTVHGLLNYTRPTPLWLSQLNVQRLIDETLAFLCHQPLFRVIRLEKQIPADLPDISADANQLSQIFMNLLLNAAEAISEGGSITISAEKKGDDSIQIHIRDTGCGIPADILPHVFEPFFTTKRGKGTGLGLSISQAYARSHGGDIHIKNSPPHGTEVTLDLPVRPQDAPVLEDEEVVV